MHTNQKVSQQLQRAAHTTKILSIILTSEYLSLGHMHSARSRNMQLKGWGATWVVQSTTQMGLPPERSAGKFDTGSHTSL